MATESLRALPLARLREQVTARTGALAAPAVLALAAWNFLWQLGSSSYHVDEVISVQAAQHSIGGVLHAVATTELTPPAYFLFLHEWLGRTSSAAESTLRLPSAICGVALVAAVYWLALRLTGRRAPALGSAALTALSPFVLDYAQRAQGYVFLALFVTVAVAAALEAQRRRVWLAVSAACAVIALTLHYTAALAIGPLCVWIACRKAFPARARIAVVSVCAMVQVALVPLFVTQHDANPVRGAADAAEVTVGNLERMVAVPFDGRAQPVIGLGVAVVVVALAGLLWWGRAQLPEWRLVVAITIGSPLVLLALTLAGGDLALTRYDAIAAPILIVALVAGLAAMPRQLRAVLVVATAGAAIAGIVASHQPSGFFADARGAVEYIAANEQPGDTVLAPGSAAVWVPLAYYGELRLKPLLRYAWQGTAQASNAVRARRRLWVVSEITVAAVKPGALLAVERPIAAAVGYRPLEVRTFRASSAIAVALWVPAARGPGR